MIIKFSSDYQINVQAYRNWILQRTTDAKGNVLLDAKGNLNPKSLLYFPDLKTLLRAYCEQDIIDNNEKLTLTEYLEKLKEEESKIKKMLEKEL